MALKTTTPTLSIKVTGVDLSQIQNMTVAIRQDSTTITKTDDSIEIDDDVLIVTLTQTESAQFKDGSANISIQATDYDGKDVSDDIKVIWAKRGSRTSVGSGGVSGDIDLSNYYTKAEVDAKLKALRDYVNSVISGGGNIEPDEPDEPQVYNLSQSIPYTQFYTTSEINVMFEVPENIKEKINKIIIKSLDIRVKGSGNGAPSFDVDFRMYRTKNGSYSYDRIERVTTNNNSTSEVRKTMGDQEINVDGITSVDYFSLYKSSSSGIGYNYSYSLSFDIDLYYEK